jgi:hypothetical protein
MSRLSYKLSAALLLISWSGAFASQALTLGSGRSVEILTLGPLQSTAGWSALMLKYRTLVPLDDIPTLRKETDEIWDKLVVDAERGGYEKAVISANGPESGSVVTANKSFNFVFDKKDGIWRTVESKDRAKAKLDVPFVKEFVDRLDWLLIHNELNAVLLYMAGDWTATSIDQTASPPRELTIDRMKFAAVTHATFAAASSHQHHREIVNISIDNSGSSARMESREAEEVTINGIQIAGVEHTIDAFALHDDLMLWTSTRSVIEKRTETRSN